MHFRFMVLGSLNHLNIFLYWKQSILFLKKKLKK